MASDMWTYRSTLRDVRANRNITGFEVSARDGDVGKIDEATYDAGSSYIVVDTGPWIFGRKVLLPAGVIDRIDVERQIVFVDLTKDEIKDAPKFDPGVQADDPSYHDQVDRYYGSRVAARR
jgi:hypothetical protein